MKKRLTTVSLLTALLPVSAMAGPGQQGSFSFSGPYAGLDAGFASNNSHLESGGARIDEGATGFAYGGHAGYGMMLNGPWYVGGEVGLSDTTGSSTISGTSLSAKESQNYLFNADLRGGRVFEQSTLAYAKLGYAHSGFHQSVVSGGGASSDDASYNGLRVGGGAETFLGNNLTGRLEAVYTDYSSQTVNNVKFSPDSVSVMLGVSYYFF